MNTNYKNTYFNVKNRDGIDYLCPLDAIKDRAAVSEHEFDECVEKDVTERYSANIDIRSA